MQLNPFNNKKKIASTKTPAQASPSSAPQSSDKALRHLGALVGDIRALNAEHDRIIAMLREAKLRKRELAEAPVPDVSLQVERELLEAAGDAKALAAFDAQHRTQLAAERDAADAVKVEATRLPERIAALETLARRVAQRMEQEIRPSAVEAAATAVFMPYAERVYETGRAYVQALRQARAAANCLTHRLTLAESNLQSEFHGSHRPDLLGRIEERGDIVPLTVAGVDYAQLRDLNHAAQDADPETARELAARLDAVGVNNDRLRIVTSGRGDASVYVDLPPVRKPMPDAVSPHSEFVRDSPINASLHR